MEAEHLHNDKDTFLAQWLSGELSDEELKALVSEADFKTFLKIRTGIETYDALEAPTEVTFRKIQAHILSNTNDHRVKSLHLKPWFIGVAAAIVLFFGLFSIIGEDITTIKTSIGSPKTFALLDGSEVVLNSKSAISYNQDEWKTDRTVHLEGEAFFKVKKGSTFTVVTKNGNVTVLGTQFNVNSTSDFFEVSCFEGRVKVESKNEAYVLNPAHSIRRINGHDTEQWESYIEKPTWIHGESSFKSVPIPYVISALESQYEITIDATNIDTTIIYTGSFTHKDLDTALKTVFKSLEIQYIEKEKGNFYLSTK